MTSSCTHPDVLWAGAGQRLSLFSKVAGGGWITVKLTQAASWGKLQGFLLYPTTSGFLRCDWGVKNYLDLPRSLTVVSVILGCIRASPDAFGDPRYAIVSRDYHIWRFNSKEDTKHLECCHAGSVAYFLNLLGLFVRNSMDRALEGHNMASTTPGQTS